MAAARDCEREFMADTRSGARLSQVSAASKTWRGKQLLFFRKASLNAKIPHLIFRQSANLSTPARASRISRGTFSTRRVPVIKRAAVLCGRSRRSALIVPSSRQGMRTPEHEEHDLLVRTRPKQRNSRETAATFPCDAAAARCKTCPLIKQAGSIVPLPTPQGSSLAAPPTLCTPSPAQPAMPCTSAKRAACCLNVWMGIVTHRNTNKTHQSHTTSRRRITKWQFASFRELRRTLLWGVGRKNGSFKWRRMIDFKSLTGMMAQTSFPL